MRKLFTSESVTEGHPDKIADQISDSILDAILAQDPKGRVACETIVTTGQIHVFGEISTSCYVDIPRIARDTVIEIGYDRAKYGFDGHTCGVLVSIDEQSGDIAMGVDKALEAKEDSAQQPEQETASEITENGEVSENKPTAQKKRSKWPTVLLIVIFIVGLGVLLYFVAVYPNYFNVDKYNSNNRAITDLFKESELFIVSDTGNYAGKSTFTYQNLKEINNLNNYINLVK